MGEFPTGYADRVDYWARRSKLWYRTMTDLTRRFARRGSRVLDYGGNEGAFEDILLRQGVAPERYVIVDANDEALNAFTKKGGKGEVATSLKCVSGEFDFILASHVMNHVDQPGFELQCLYRMLEFNGTLAVVGPNPWHDRARWWTRLVGYRDDPTLRNVFSQNQFRELGRAFLHKPPVVEYRVGERVLGLPGTEQWWVMVWKR